MTDSNPVAELQDAHAEHQDTPVAELQDAHAEHQDTGALKKEFMQRLSGNWSKYLRGINKWNSA
jgi:hypothetical protein